MGSEVGGAAQQAPRASSVPGDAATEEGDAATAHGRTHRWAAAHVRLQVRQVIFF
jgi:hypothetical protein